MHILASAPRTLSRRAIHLTARSSRMVFGWAAWMAVLSAALAQPPSSPDVASREATTIRLVAPDAPDTGTILLKLRRVSKEPSPNHPEGSPAIAQTSWTKVFDAGRSRKWTPSADRDGRSSVAMSTMGAPKVRRLPRPPANNITIATFESVFATQQRPSTQTPALVDSPVPGPSSLNRVFPEPGNRSKGRETLDPARSRQRIRKIAPGGLMRFVPSSNEEQSVDSSETAWRYTGPLLTELPHVDHQPADAASEPSHGNASGASTHVATPGTHVVRECL